MAKASAAGYGVSGSGEYTRTDYQEHRKDTALNAGIAFIFLAAVAVAFWYIASKLVTSIPNPMNTINDIAAGVNRAYTGAKENVVADSSYPITPEQAVNEKGEYYPVTTQDGLMQRLEQSAFTPLITAGNAITGGMTTQAGSAAAVTVNKLDLNNQYDALDPISKTFVSVGEGIGNIFSISPITMGHDLQSQINASMGVVTPSKPTTTAATSTEYDNYIGV